jgi:hypothetical protein
VTAGEAGPTLGRGVQGEIDRTLWLFRARNRPNWQLADTVLKPPPARIVRSRFPAVTIFTANRGDGSASRVEVVEAEDALLTRPVLEVEARRLPLGGAIFIARLIAGDSLGAAASAAFSDTPSFDLAANISGMLEAGAFAAAIWGESAGAFSMVLCGES